MSSIIKEDKTPNRPMSRKEAIRKAGKYAAITAASMLVVLSPKESQAQSSVPSKPSSWT
ncbi:MAG: hypothetical protein R2757_03200 [Draconibacterium sp.]